MRLLVLMLAAVLVTPLAAAERLNFDGIQGLGDTRHHLFASTALDKAFHVLVGLPRNYDESGGDRFPVMLILDGGELYPLLRAYHGYLVNGREVPEMILVGVSYGTSDWQNGNDRSHDYTAPSAEREHWGGAAAFQRFLAEELLPFVDASYRTRANRRIIFGQSLGGQFVLFTALTRPDLFWGHIASNPALHRNLDFFLQSLDPDAAGGQPGQLFVGTGSEDDPEFRVPLGRWVERARASGDRQLRLHVETLEGHSHFSAPPAAFRQGLRWLFPVERQPLAALATPGRDAGP